LLTHNYKTSRAAHQRLEKIIKKKENATEAETITNTIACLQAVLGVDLKAKDLDVAVVSVANKRVRKLGENEVDDFLTAIAEKD